MGEKNLQLLEYNTKKRTFWYYNKQGFLLVYLCIVFISSALESVFLDES
jgi:hypothetical protein